MSGRRGERPLDGLRSYLRDAGAYYEDLADPADEPGDRIGTFASGFATELRWDDQKEIIRGTADIGSFPEGEPQAEWFNVLSYTLQGVSGNEGHIIAPGGLAMEGRQVYRSVDIVADDEKERFDQISAFGKASRLTQGRIARSAADFEVPFELSDQPIWQRKLPGSEDS